VGFQRAIVRLPKRVAFRAREGHSTPAYAKFSIEATGQKGDRTGAIPDHLPGSMLSRCRTPALRRQRSNEGDESLCWPASSTGICYGYARTSTTNVIGA
jgi:hypothetical protein